MTIDTSNSASAGNITKSPQKKCANCGHNVMIYNHPLSSSTLTFHDNDGVFGMTCICGCKNPKIKEGKK